MLGQDLTGDRSRHRVVFPDRGMIQRPYVFLPNHSRNRSSNCYDYESEQPVENKRCSELRSLSNEMTRVNQLLILKNLIPEAGRTLGTWSTNETRRVN